MSIYPWGYNGASIFHPQGWAIDTTSQKEVTNRLRRARGRIDGVIAMIESGACSTNPEIRT